jgi:hypothetical protein
VLPRSRWLKRARDRERDERVARTLQRARVGTSRFSSSNQFNTTISWMVQMFG